MNDPYEPSYYEIALTGRQVLVAFVVLLACLVTAFFSGVWVGQSGEGTGGGRAEEMRAEAGDAGEAGEVVEGEEARLEELSFFDEEEPTGRPRESGQAAAESRPDTTLREDVEGQPADAAAAEAPPADAQPPAREARGEPPPEAAGERRPRRDANPSGSLATGDIVIQVFSTGEEENAREVLARLERNGFRAFLSPTEDGGRTLYRVRVGPFEHRSEAEEVAARLRRSLNLETWITQ